MNQADQPAAPDPAHGGPGGGEFFSSHSRLIWLLAIAAVFLIGFLIFYLTARSIQPLDNFFKVLEEQGYRPNPGFSGNFAPGNVVQLSEIGPDGTERPLEPPLVVLWKDQCFPDKALNSSIYVLPELAGEGAASINLGADFIHRAVPALQVESGAALSYSMKLEDTRVLSFAKLDLSQQFSDVCVQRLEKELLQGNKAEWYGVILEAVVSEGISFTIDWRENASAEARSKNSEKAKQALSTMLEPTAGVDLMPTGTVKFSGNSNKTTTLKADGRVVVGYRVRRLEPMYEQ